MGKGRKKALTTSKDQEALKGTKENQPEMNGEVVCKVQPTLSTFWSPSKPRSPLGSNSSVVVQDQNVSDAQTSQVSTSELDKVSRLEENSERTGPVLESKDKVTTPPETSNIHRESSKSVAPPKTMKRTSHKAKAKNADSLASLNKKVTDYYPIRRSARKSKTELKNEEHQHIEDLIMKGVEEGLKVKHIEGKGRGVFAVRDFKKGEFVVEYLGDLLDLAEAKKREELYSQDPEAGCYMYYFQYHDKTYCVDATRETSRVGRLLNHSKNGNCQTKLHGIKGTPHLVLVASRDVRAGEELLYDYGDRSKASISAHPWLKQ